MKTTNPWYVLTGGPCAGKTTLVKEFEADGIRVVHESARVIIEKGMAEGKTLEEIRDDGALFTRDIIALDTANLDLHPGSERVFFDRSIIDNIGYHRHLGFEPSPELVAACESASFARALIPKPSSERFRLDPRACVVETKRKLDVLKVHDGHFAIDANDLEVLAYRSTF